MIVVDDRVLCEAEELDALLQAAETLGETVEKASVTLEEAVNAFQVAIMDLSCPTTEQQTKPYPAIYHCRVCGRGYDFKGDARACEREHKRPWRR